MPTLVEHGAIQSWIAANKAKPLTDEVTEIGDQVAVAYCDKGQLVWTKEDGQVRLLPFGEPEEG